MFQMQMKPKQSALKSRELSLFVSIVVTTVFAAFACNTKFQYNNKNRQTIRRKEVYDACARPPSPS